MPCLLVIYVNAGPLERCGPGIHMYERGPSRLTWLTRVIVGPVWLVQYVYLVATYADWDLKVDVLQLCLQYVNEGST